MSGRRGAGRAGSGAGRGCRQLGSGRLTGAGGAHRDAGAVRDGEVGIERVPLIHGLLPTLDLVADLCGRQRHLRHRAPSDSPSVRRTTGGERKWRIVPRALLLSYGINTQNFVLMVQQTGRSPGPNNARVTRPLRAHSWSCGSRLGNMSSRKFPFSRLYCFRSAFFSASPNGTPNFAAGLRFHLELWKGVAACAELGSSGSSSSLPPMPSRPSWGSLGRRGRAGGLVRGGVKVKL